MPGRRQGHPVSGCDGGIGAGDHIEKQAEVAGAARHGSDHRKVGVDRERRHSRRRLPAARDQRLGRLVREYATIVRGRAQRAADIGAELQRHVAGRQRRRRAAGRAARRAAEIPGVVRGAVDLVEALPVRKRDRHVGLAQHDGACRLGARHDQRILRRPPVLAARKAPGCRQARDVEGLLDRHGDAEQRPALAGGQRLVGLRRRRPRPLEIAHDHGVDAPVQGLDARNGVIGQLHGRDLPRRQGRNERLRGAVFEAGRSSSARLFACARARVATIGSAAAAPTVARKSRRLCVPGHDCESPRYIGPHVPRIAARPT